MRRHTYRRCAIAAGAIVLAAAALGSLTLSNGVAATTKAGAAAASSCTSNTGDIHIGVSGPQSGLYAIVGDSQQGGLQVAIQQLGSAGIHGRKVVMDSKDDQFSPTTAVNNFVGFVNQSGICAMVGPTDTSSTQAVSQADRALPGGPIPQIGVLGSDDSIAPHGPGTKPNNFMFGVLTGNWPELTILTNYTLTHFSGEKIGIIRDPTAYGKNQADFLTRLLAQKHLKPVINEPLPVNTPDPSPQVNKALSAGTQVLFALTSFDDVARIARTLRAQNSKVQIMCTDQCAVIPDFIKNAGPAANGTISTKIAGTALPPTPALRAFSAKYDKLTGYKAFPPPDWALGTYDAANILFSIWKRVGTDPAKVFKAWEQVKHYRGLSCSDISFSPLQHNGLGDQSCYRLMIIKNQKAVLMPGQKK